MSFAREMVKQLSPCDGAVLDPFCGRGTTPFVAMAAERFGFGSEINPVGWLFATVKTNPHQNVEAVIHRLREVGRAVRLTDRQPANEFQAWAWCPTVLGFLHAARRELNWQDSQLDRTLMGFIGVYLHAKLGGGISNQMRQSKAMAPDYSVRWWKSRGMRPPELDPVEYFEGRIRWRYAHGIVEGPTPEIRLGDSMDELCNAEPNHFDLLLTSPPYCGVTNYKYDNWIRLWLLGGPALPEWDTVERYEHSDRYREIIHGIFYKAARALRPDASICVRTDTREFTLQTTLEILLRLFPRHAFFLRQERPKRTQTALYGDKRLKPGETDILALPVGTEPLTGFLPHDEFGIADVATHG
jgi:hypothetical protein